MDDPQTPPASEPPLSPGLLIPSLNRVVVSNTALHRPILSQSQDRSANSSFHQRQSTATSTITTTTTTTTTTTIHKSTDSPSLTHAALALPISAPVPASLHSALAPMTSHLTDWSSQISGKPAAPGQLNTAGYFGVPVYPVTVTSLGFSPAAYDPQTMELSPGAGYFPAYHLPRGILTPTAGIPNMVPQPAPMDFIAQLPRKNSDGFEFRVQPPVKRTSESSNPAPSSQEASSPGSQEEAAVDQAVRSEAVRLNEDQLLHSERPPSPTGGTKASVGTYAGEKTAPNLKASEFQPQTIMPVLHWQRSPSPSPSADDPATMMADQALKAIVTSAIATRKNIYIRGLPPHTTDDSLRDLCSTFGTVVSAKAIIEQTPMRLANGEMVTVNGSCKGYGFTMFETERMAQHAIECLNQMGFDVSLAKESFSTRLKSLQDQDTTNLYVSNIPFHFSEVDLNALFTSLGCRVMSSRILREQMTGASRGVGFARLDTRSSCVKAIEHLNGLLLDPHTLPLQLRFADNTAQKKLKSQTSRRKLPGTSTTSFSHGSSPVLAAATLRQQAGPGEYVYPPSY